VPSENRDEEQRRHDSLELADLGFPGMLESGTLTDLGSEFRELVEGAARAPEEIEATLSVLPLPDGTDIDVDTVAVPDGRPDSVEVEQVVETGGQVVKVAVDGTGEAGSVLVDTGGDVVEVVVEGGGKEAVEATGEIIAAALEGL